MTRCIIYSMNQKRFVLLIIVIGGCIDLVVSLCNVDISLGIDSFKISFLRRFRYRMREDMGIFFTNFHSQTSLPPSFFSYFVTLISKVESLAQLGDF